MSKVEFNWDIFPSTKLEADRMIGPIGCMFTPFDKPIDEVSESNPIECSSCKAIINQFSRFDRRNREWWCPFCQKKTTLPTKFVLPESGCEDSEVPLVIRPNPEGTVDYILPQDITQPKISGVFVAYVIDIYSYPNQPLAIDEFFALKLAIAESIRFLKKDTKVLIITFAEKVALHRGKDIAPIELSLNGDASQKFPTIDLKSLKNSLENDDVFSTTSEDLIEYIQQLQPIPVDSVKSARLTGLALLGVCSIIQEYAKLFALGKVLLFVSGPATLEPGKVADISGPIRSHPNILNHDAPYLASATTFYKELSLASAGHSLKTVSTAVQSSGTSRVARGTPLYSFDIFIGSSDQVGLYEMKSLVEAGNGTVYLNESFASKRFEDALISGVTEFNNQNRNCVITILPSKGLRVLKAVFNSTELESSHSTTTDLELHHERISDSITKYDHSMKQRKFTNRWFMGNLNDRDTAAFFFEVNTVSKSSKLNSSKFPKEFLVQFQTKFYDTEMERYVLRVATVRRATTLAILESYKHTTFSGKPKLVHLQSNIIKEKMVLESFNAKVWTCLTTRLLINKISTPLGYEPIEGTLIEVEKDIIRLLHNFGGIDIKQSKSGENPFENLTLSYSIHANFKELPSYAYNLNRNHQLTRMFNCSPDETAFYHHLFKCLNVEDSDTMIRPKLYKISKNTLEEVPLNWESIGSAREHSQYFVMDALCTLVIFKRIGESSERLPLHPSNNDKNILESSKLPEVGSVIQTVYRYVLNHRKINPRIILTQSGHSQARYLHAWLKTIPGRQVQTPKKWYKFLSSAPKALAVTPNELTLDEFCEELLDKVRVYKQNML